MKLKILLITALLVAVHSAYAQSVIDLIRQTPSYASCNYHTYPDSITA